MAATIKIKNSSTAGAAPTSSDLVQGELAVNVTDKRLYTENSGGTIVELGTNPSVPVTFPDGSASAPSLTNDGDTNTGLFFPAADTVGITTGGTERARVDSSGNFGVGTTSSLGKVHASSSSFGGSVSSNANQLIAESSGNAGVTIATGASSLGNIFFADSGDSADGYIQYDQSGRSMRFGTATAEKMRLDSSGNLGLGVTPSAWGTGSSVRALQFNSGSLWNYSNTAVYLGHNYYFNGTNRLYSNTGPAAEYQLYNGTHAWNIAGSGSAGAVVTFTQAMTLDASGRLGLGVTSPSLSFEVGINAAKGYMHSGVGVFSVGTSTNHPYGFDINGTERARIDTSGNLLVGVTGTTSGAKFVTKGNGSTGATYNIYTTNSSSAVIFATEDGGVIYTGTLAGSPYNNTTASAANMFVTSGGVLQRSTSSLKYKQNVQDSVHGLVDLLKLRSVTYEGKSETDDGKTFGGLIAEEVHEAGLTEFVQYAEDGTPDALAYGNMVSLCIKAIQELNAKFEAYKAAHP